jgi:hypothetical protein
MREIFREYLHEELTKYVAVTDEFLAFRKLSSWGALRQLMLIGHLRRTSSGWRLSHHTPQTCSIPWILSHLASSNGRAARFVSNCPGGRKSGKSGTDESCGVCSQLAQQLCDCPRNRTYHSPARLPTDGHRQFSGLLQTNQ